MAHSSIRSKRLENGGMSTALLVKPKVDPPTGFSVPSQKLVLDYFYSKPEVQKMYAERVSSMMNDFVVGRVKTYPANLNSSMDIVDFIFNNRCCKVNQADTLAEDFLGMSISPTPLQAKRKREREEVAKAPTKVKVLPAKKAVKPVQTQEKKSKPVRAKAESSVGKFNITGRDRKMLSFPLMSIPNFLTFFPNPRVNMFSSKGGLHDITCKICYEIGFYTAVDSAGVRRKLDLGQKAWIATLHDLVDQEGLIPKGAGEALLAVQRHVEKPVDMVAVDASVTELPQVSSEDRIVWADTQSEEQKP